MIFSRFALFIALIYIIRHNKVLNQGYYTPKRISPDFYFRNARSSVQRDDVFHWTNMEWSNARRIFWTIWKYGSSHSNTGKLLIFLPSWPHGFIIESLTKFHTFIAPAEDTVKSLLYTSCVVFSYWWISYLSRLIYSNFLCYSEGI